MTNMVQLHCPANGKTVDKFVISPFQTNEQVLQTVRLALGIKYAALYAVDAKHITDVQSLQEDQRVLVAAEPLERMLPDAPSGFILYDGEEGDDVDPDVEGFGQAWEDLTEREKCDHIASLNEQKPTTRNKLRITRPYQSVQADLSMIEIATPEQMASRINPANLEANIEQRWRLTYDHILPESMRPPKFKVAGKIWDEKALAALETLSSFTHGQARLVTEFLEEAVRMRIDEVEDASPVVQFQDVVHAIAIIYERAGVIPAKLTKPRSAKTKEKERRKALKEKKKAEARDRTSSGTS